MRVSPRPLCVAALVLASLCGATGCQTAYYPVRYAPVPLESRVETAADAQVSGRVLITVLGVRRADEEQGLPAGVEMRIRVENLGTKPFAVDPTDFKLLSADLRTFAAPRVTPPDPVEVGADDSGTLDVYFPFPFESSVDEFAMDSLNLRWTIVVNGGERITAAATFDRIYGPDYGPAWGVSMGIGL